jgi:hypothetical protein
MWKLLLPGGFMHMAFTLFTAPFVVLGVLFGSIDDQSIGKMKEEIRIQPVPATVESSTVMLVIAVPKPKELVSKNPVWVQFRIDGFALGSDSSQFQRANQIAVSDMGQTVHVIVDNEPYFAINEPAINPFNENGYYYNTSYKFEIPFKLQKGVHTLRMFPARSFGESLKGENTFAFLKFYVGDVQTDKKFDFSQPFLTYNEPSDQMDYGANQPILLDFLIANCELSQDGYKVQLTFDDSIKRTLTSWQPYYIYGLGRGKHKIRLELINKDVRVPGLFNDVERTITIR